ncbi:uncharacterized protein LOC130726839 [Lotus japonicus]|uniref:uncharacterized protein LOC130726839 n=1 Tax=Lotus japonicus TaxID=34305 RepID=UPI002590BFB4|nr:uncharacterized protein LOC130726839 [Lotus japonicus]
MNKIQKSQVLVLFVLVLLVITPFLPSSLRPTFLYFILNFTIIALGAEAGLLSVFSSSLEHRNESESSSEKKEASTTEHVKKELKGVENSAAPQSQRIVFVRKMNNVVQNCPSRPEALFTEKIEAPITTCVNGTSEIVKEELKAVEKSAVSQRDVCVTIVEKVQKCLSRPSLFFIGGGEADAETMDEEEHEAEEEIGGVLGQELFAKAEAFIGNFYKQLKMQREESSIHQKSF